MYRFSFLLIALLLMASCSKSDDSVIQGQKNITLKSTDQLVVEQSNAFSLNMFREMLGNDPEGANVFMSPMSMYYALAMAYNGANGLTYDEFKTLLGWDGLSEEEILESLNKLYNYLLTGTEGIELSLANSIWPRIDFPIKQEFIDVNKQYLNAEVKPLDFGLPNAVDIINGWIEENTNGKITNALDQIPADAALYLINAIYFNATWKYEFKASDNNTGEFYLLDHSTKEVTYMNQEATLEYAYSNNFAAVKLPYSDSNFYMSVLLPDDGYTPNDIISTMDTTAWANLSNSFSKRNVRVKLPKFKFVYGTRNINTELQTLGLQQAFSNDADFSKITDTGVQISRVLHKAFVDVSEKGTEAAAVTIVEFVYTSAGGGNESPIISFNVTKPFLFAICEKQTNAIVFMGKVMEPIYD